MKKTVQKNIAERNCYSVSSYTVPTKIRAQVIS